MEENRQRSEIWLERLLRKLRFRKALKHLKKGRILDFGCDDASLKEFLPENLEYVCCERDYSVIKGKFDTIFMLAVIEHLEKKEAEKVMGLLFNSLRKGGKLVMTTPSRSCEKILNFLAFKLHLLNENGIREHKYYWSKKDLFDLANKYNLDIDYKTFQFGLNQMIIFKKNEKA